MLKLTETLRFILIAVLVLVVVLYVFNAVGVTGKPTISDYMERTGENR